MGTVGSIEQARVLAHRGYGEILQGVVNVDALHTKVACVNLCSISPMNTPNPNLSRSILTAFSGYLLLCGLSAIFFPKSWLWAAGLATNTTPELSLVFGVLGVYLTSLSVGAWIASRAPNNNHGVIITLIASQMLDFLFTLKGVFSGALPKLQGTGFLVVTVVFSTLLCVALRQSKKVN
jgi:hypothetical protein